MRSRQVWAAAALPIVVAAGAIVSIATAAPGRPLADPFCTASYSSAPAKPGSPLRFGIDPGLAGNAGGAQLPAVPDNPRRDLEAVKALGVRGRTLVVRLNRLFWSDGDAGIASFRKATERYTRAGFEVEIQVRYHPSPGEAGDLRAWEAYVRRVVDALGSDPRVMAMTITNEVNVQFSPNTSDGYYPGARDALIRGIEAAHGEALRRGFRQLRFGFTYAYRFVPSQDGAFFSYLGSHGGSAFRSALGFVGLDFYPGTIYPLVMAPGDSYRGELAQAGGVVRDCLAPMAGIAPAVPIWITENGVPTGLLSDQRQAEALASLVQAARAYSGTFNITDYRWFNLRDSVPSGPATLIGLTFATDGLLRADYTAKPSFAVYRSLIARFGARPSALAPSRRRRTLASSAVPERPPGRLRTAATGGSTDSP